MAYTISRVPDRIYGSLFLTVAVEGRVYFLFETENGHVPSESLTITPYIQYRTIYPFG